MQRKAIFGFYTLRTKDLVKDVYGKEEFQAIIKREKARADRSGNCFSFVVFIAKKNAEILKLKNLAELIRLRARIIDSVGWLENNRIGIVLPGTPIDGAKKFGEEISLLCKEEIIRDRTEYIYPSAHLSKYHRNFICIK